MKPRHLALGLSSVLIVSANSWAVGLEKPIFWSGKYAGLGGAAASSVRGAEALYFNPAGLTRATTTIENDAVLNFSPTFTSTTTPVTAPSAATPSKNLFSPIGSVMVSREVMPGVGIGLGAYAGGGLGVDYGNVLLPSTTVPAELRTNLSDIEIALGAGYQLTPTISVGAAWRVSMINADFTTVASGYNTKLLGQTGTNYSGFRFGAQYSSEDGIWGLGATVRTSVELKASGSATSYSLVGLATPPASPSELVTTLPLQFTLGGHYIVNPELKFFLQYDYTQYSQNKDLSTTVGGINGLTPMNWKDRHNIRLAGEYTGVQNWPIRLAYVFTSQVTPTETPNIYFTAPGAAHSLVLGTGTLIASNLTLDAAIEYTMASGKGAPSAGVAAYAGDYSATAYALHTGLSYRF